MRHKGDLPAFSEHVIEINKKLSSLQAINFSSAGDLANLILKDVSLTNKLLKVVNSSYYGNVGGSVTTISRAVFLMGAENIRLAAASLMILDHLQSKSQTDDLKDAALSSYFSATIARDVAKTMMYGNLEEVFICALLHNLGKHLVICYFPEEYLEIKTIVTTRNIDEQAASKNILGVSYNELGMGVTKSWGFPPSITESMDSIRGGADKASDSETSLLKSIANYANDLCAVAAQADPAKREEALKAVRDKYQASITFPANRAMGFIEEASDNINLYAEMFRVNPAHSPLIRALKVRASSPEAPGRNAKADDAKKMAYLEAETPRRSLSEKERADILKSCILEINETLSATQSISDAIYMIIEAIYRGFEFNRVLFCMLDQTQSRMSARFGFGDKIDAVLEKFNFKISRSSDYFNIAVMRQRDIVVDDRLLPSVTQNLPEWYLWFIEARSFLIYPLTVREKCIGLLYAEKKTPHVFNNSDERDYMNILRDKAIWAILHKH